MTETTTQTTNPWITTWRTMLQTAAGTILGTTIFITTLGTLAPQILDAIHGALPPEWATYATAAVALITTIAGATARLMAIPTINEWLRKIRLGQLSDVP